MSRNYESGYRSGDTRLAARMATRVADDCFTGGSEISDCPFANLPEKRGAHRMDCDKMKKVRWMKPEVFCEVAFNERTEAGRLRHSKFLRLRERADRPSTR